jgi:hypothetical protein
MDPALVFALTATLADYGQTRWIGNHPQEYTETGTHCMGSHPSATRVGAYMGALAAGTIAANILLPKPWGTTVALIVGVNETVAVAHNASIGVKFTF